MFSVSLGDYETVNYAKSLVIDKLPWVEKYRPKDLNHIMVNDMIKQKVETILKNSSMPNLIITGEPGTGKTSTVKYIAKKLIDKKYYNKAVLELNASDDRGLNMINNTILHFCEKYMSHIPHKIVILDEADSITRKAQDILTNVIESNLETTRFAFICNDKSKIIESIQSKCVILNYPRMEKEWIEERINFIIEEENIPNTKEGIRELIFCSNGDIRVAINYLECIFYSMGQVTEETVQKLCQKPKPQLISKVFENLLNNKFILSIENTKDLVKLGYSPNDILITMMSMIFDDHYVKLNKDQQIIFLIKLSKTMMKFNDSSDSIKHLIGCLASINKKLEKCNDK